MQGAEGLAAAAMLYHRSQGWRFFLSFIFPGAFPGPLPIAL